jgi:hypothetical protein
MRFHGSSDSSSITNKKASFVATAYNVARAVLWTTLILDIQVRSQYLLAGFSHSEVALFGSSSELISSIFKRPHMSAPQLDFSFPLELSMNTL